MIDVEEGRLATLHEQGFTLIKCLIEQLSSINDHGFEPLGVRHEIVHDLVCLNMAAVIDLHEQLVFLPQRAFNLLPQNRLIQNILHANTQAPYLIHVGGSNTTPGRADCALTQETFGDLIHRLVVRCHKVGICRDFEFRGVGAARLQTLNLREKCLRVHHHAVADHGGCVLAQNAGGQQLKLKFLAVHHHGMPSVVAAVRLDHVVRAGSEQVGCLTFTFIAPLGAHDHNS